MAKTILHKQAIELRLKGYTYSQIKRNLGVSKSTLSDWLRNLPLTEDQQKLLISNKDLAEDLRRERFRTTMQNLRLEKLKKIHKEQEQELLPLTKKELFLAGVFLYWGEGSKQRGLLSLSNTNPQIIKFGFYWMVNVLGVPTEKIQVRLHLYKDMNIAESTKFWADLLCISDSQFKRPYIKDTNRSGLTYKSFGKGTCNLMVLNSALSDRVAMSLKALSDYYGAKSDHFWYN